MEPEVGFVKRHIALVNREEKKAVDGSWERLVTGIVADPENVDSYGNTISAEVIREAAFRFMEDYQNFGINHEKIDGKPVLYNDKIAVVESWITREKTTIGGTEVPKGAWVLTCRVKDDSIWQGVLDGTYTGFSLEALAKRVEI